jgi:hypothetical protein
MGMPRLGDDAFTHLWRAAQIERVGAWSFALGDGVETRAGDGILSLCSSDTSAAPQVRARCARLADNTAVPDVKPAASLLLQEVVRLGLPLKWSYAVYETLIAAIVAVAFAYFLTKLLGPEPAGFAMVPLSVLVLLPPQGLHQFIPSTLAIGLSLALWGLVIRTGSVPRYVAAAIGFAVASRVHPVALVYAGGLAVLAAYAFRHKLTLKSAALVAAAGLVALGLFLAFSDTIRHVIAQALSADLLNVVAANASALPGRLAAFCVHNWAFVAAFAASLIVCRRFLDGWTAAVAVALLLMAAASLLYRTEFFTFNIPLDLFARVFVGAAVLASGVLAAVAVGLLDRPGWKRWSIPAVAVGIVLVSLPSFVAWRASLYGNVNGRPEVIDEAALKTVVARFDPSATLAYGELDLAPTAAFLAGAADLGAIPMNALSPGQLAAAVSELHPAAIVLPNFRALNSLAVVRSHSLERRRYGFSAHVIDAVAVSLPREGIRSIRLRVENPGAAAVSLGPNTYLDEGKRPHEMEAISVPPGTRDWITIEIDPALPARTVIVNLPPSALWIEGVAVNGPARDGVAWPWDHEAVVQWHFRELPRDQIMGVQFAIPMLFRAWSTPGLGVIPVAKEHPVIGDDSGLVFIATGYPGPGGVPAQGAERPEPTPSP